MKTALVLPAIAISALMSQLARADVFVEIFQDYVDTGSSITMTNPVGSFTAESVNFYIGEGGAWHPFGLNSFSARITGNLYFDLPFINARLGLGSSDGSYMFLEGNPLIQNGGIHPFGNVASDQITLSTFDPHPFEIQFFKSSGGGISGVELGGYLPHGPFYHFGPEKYDPVPEPITLVSVLSGLLFMARRSKKSG